MKLRFLIVIFLLPPSIAYADIVESEEMLAAEVLELAERTGQWLADNAISQPTGIAWPDNALTREAISYDLATGVAGKVVYFVALYQATGNPDYLDLATGGADYLVATLQDPAVFDENPRRSSLYAGVSGIGVALVSVERVTGRRTYADGVDTVISLLETWSVEDEQGLRWSDEFNDILYGDAGTVLFLSWYAGQAGDQRALAMAHRGARFLLGQGAAAADGLSWFFRRSKPFNLPNFSHGTAGLTYVLATVGAQMDDASLKQGARAGFDYIKSIAAVEDGLLRIPYGWGSDNWDGLYEFGWAHGLVGTTSMFIRLQQTGIDVVSAAEFEELARHTLRSINLPGVPSAPFAEPATPLDLRFGRAGVLAIAGGWNGSDTGARQFRNDLWLHIERAAILDGNTAHWEVDAPEFMGGGRAAYTGMLHGAAGIGLAILHMHARLSDRQPYVDLPDRPAN